MVKINFNSNHRVSRRHVPLPDVTIRNWTMRHVSAMLSKMVVWKSGIFCANRAVVILPYKFRERKKVRVICVLVKGEVRYKTTLWLILRPIKCKGLANMNAYASNKGIYRTDPYSDTKFMQLFGGMYITFHKFDTLMKLVHEGVMEWCSKNLAISNCKLSFQTRLANIFNGHYKIQILTRWHEVFRSFILFFLLLWDYFMLFL